MKIKLADLRGLVREVKSKATTDPSARLGGLSANIRATKEKRALALVNELVTVLEELGDPENYQLVYELYDRVRDSYAAKHEKQHRKIDTNRSAGW